MIQYVLIDPVLGVVQRGACPTEEEIPRVPGLRHEVVASADPRQPTTAPPPSYGDFRRMEYPSVGDQLDALWKIIAALEVDSPAAKQIAEQIAEVKARYPKPG